MFMKKKNRKNRKKRLSSIRLSKDLNRLCKPGLSGIYEIKIGDKYYVGSSSNMKYRVKQHLIKLKSGKHINSNLQYAYDNIGEFKPRRLFTVDNPYMTRYELYVFEKYIISRRKDLYNIADVPCYNNKWKSCITEDILKRSKQGLIYYLKTNKLLIK